MDLLVVPYRNIFPLREGGEHEFENKFLADICSKKMWG